jgi:(p)ppGpp synthase/HD superfamily hydrolase
MNVEETIEFIKEAHRGYREKLGKPYWNHPYRVMRFLGPFASKEKKQAALLHDVIEDTTFDEEDLLRLGFSKKTVEMVKILTHNVLKDTYDVYILKIIFSGNFGAMHIKFADLFDFAMCELINKFRPS